VTEFDAQVLAVVGSRPQTAEEIARQLARGPIAVKGAIGRLRARGLIDDHGGAAT